jgi:hypothetical protein
MLRHNCRHRTLEPLETPTLSAYPDHHCGHRLSCLARHGQEARRAAEAGHGAGKPVSKVIEEEADLLAFLFKYLEVR